MELEDQFGIKISDEDAQKIQTVGQAVDYVSARTSKTGAEGLSFRARAPDRGASSRAARARPHALVVGDRPRVVVRAARVPRRQRARARDRARPLRPAARRLGGAAGEDPLARRLAAELRRGRARPRPRLPASRQRRGHPGRRAATNRPQPQRARGAARGGDRGPLPRARLRGDRARRRRGLRGSHRGGADDHDRPQDRAAGGARPERAPRLLLGARREGAAARAPLRLCGARRRRGARPGHGPLEEGRRAGGRQDGARCARGEVETGTQPNRRWCSSWVAGLGGAPSSSRRRIRSSS